MAAPHVTAAVALLLAQGLNGPEAVQRLLDTADPTVKCGADSPTCRGRLDVAKATQVLITGKRPTQTHVPHSGRNRTFQGEFLQSRSNRQGAGQIDLPRGVSVRRTWFRRIAVLVTAMSVAG